MRRRVVGFLVGALAVLAIAPATLAAAPNPSSSPGCGGLIVAATNHASGAGGASGNSRASAGPGYFLRSDTRAAIEGVRNTFCPS